MRHHRQLSTIVALLVLTTALTGCSSSADDDASTGIIGPVDWCAVPCASSDDCPRTHVCVPTVVDGVVEGVCGGELCPSAECVCGDRLCDEACGETLENCSCDCAVPGDDICSPCGENPLTVPEDCCGGCGDGLCVGFACGENPHTCPLDCGATCGDGVCEYPEGPTSCPEDCRSFECGNGVCEPSDGGPEVCPGDCNEFCGNCACDIARGETFVDCPIDCGSCGDGICSSCIALNENSETCPEDCCVPLPETCNGVDDDCDGLVDEENAVGCSVLFADTDGDGFGDDGDSACLCEPARPFTAKTGGDCDESNGDVHPDATEVCNGRDDNCVAGVDEGFAVGTPCEHSDPCQRGTMLCGPNDSIPRCEAVQPRADGVLCAPASCGSATELIGHGQCDGLGNCQLGGSTQCTGGCSVVDETAVCAGPCTNDLECPSGTFCENGQCPALAAQGEACLRDGGCTSSFCADGVCCDSACNGDCRSCDQVGGAGTCQLAADRTDPDGDCELCRMCNGNGACSLVEEGADPLSHCTATDACGFDGFCDGAGACSLIPDGTECEAAACVESLFFAASTCTSGTCSPSFPPTSCGSSNCDATGTGCMLGCTSPSDCAPGFVCGEGIGGAMLCQAPRPLAASCTAADQCESGFCSDGVCCNNACTGLCRGCDAASGLCIATAPGEADATTCDGANTCDSDGDCSDSSSNKVNVNNDCCIPAQAGSTSPGCAVIAIETAVCTSDASCCATTWSQDCADLASTLGSCP